MGRIVRPKRTGASEVLSDQARPTGGIPTFGAANSEFNLEAISDDDRPGQLRFEQWDRRRAKTVDVAHHRGQKLVPAGCPKKPGQCSSLSSAEQSFRVDRPFDWIDAGLFAPLCPDSARRQCAFAVAFALATWFSDCLPVAPFLYLLGAEHEVAFILRLLRVFCRRAVLLADVDIAALRSLPKGLQATLLIKRRDLSGAVKQLLLASADPHFVVARGSTQLNAWCATAFSAHGESVNGLGVRVCFSPRTEPVPRLSDEQLEVLTKEFQAKLLRYREINWQRVRDAQPDPENLAPELRDEFRTWMSPLPESLKSAQCGFGLVAGAKSGTRGRSVDRRPVPGRGGGAIFSATEQIRVDFSLENSPKRSIKC